MKDSYLAPTMIACKIVIDELFAMSLTGGTEAQNKDSFLQGLEAGTGGEEEW